MNKYKRELIRVQKVFAIIYLPELVERATPKKPNVMTVDKQEWLVCPKCGYDTMKDYINKYDFCPSCGQSIDWSVKE